MNINNSQEINPLQSSEIFLNGKTTAQKKLSQSSEK
jgi:hypothetical protein